MLTYEEFFDEKIYNTILDAFPAAGALQIDSIKYLLINDNLARKLSAKIILRSSIVKLLEKYDISTDKISKILIERGIGVAEEISEFYPRGKLI